MKTTSYLLAAGLTTGAIALYFLYNRDLVGMVLWVLTSHQFFIHRTLMENNKT